MIPVLYLVIIPGSVPSVAFAIVAAQTQLVQVVKYNLRMRICVELSIFEANATIKKFNSCKPAAPPVSVDSNEVYGTIRIVLSEYNLSSTSVYRKRYQV